MMQRLMNVWIAVRALFLLIMANLDKAHVQRQNQEVLA